MSKEQLPENVKKVDFLQLYLQADTHLVQLKNILLDFKDGIGTLINRVKSLEDQIEEVKKKK